MRVTFLTSSRADFGIIRPLIQRMNDDNYFKVSLIVFGTHLAEQYGKTIKEIEKENFYIARTVETVVRGDGPEAISMSVGVTFSKFASVWKEHETDLVICLGDRYEMFAAVGASVPFNIPIAHISGGEVTEGAIDNVYRNALSLMATYHFASTDLYKNNIVRLRGSSDHVYNVGALNIDNLKTLPIYSKEVFFEKFGIDMSIPTILITFHPETVSYQNNEYYVKELIGALGELKYYQLVITMPNADTMGQLIRQYLTGFIQINSMAIGVESFGSIGYMSCMKHCTFMLGNTSSGFVEASFFPKPVINLGNRQNGRVVGKHMINCPIEKTAILNAVKTIELSAPESTGNIYGNGDTAKRIMDIIKDTLHQIKSNPTSHNP
jgi:GDP/UDP-N,N'-diacetylbacillosamine 2-epimerase (hydrolysing)